MGPQFFSEISYKAIQNMERYKKHNFFWCVKRVTEKISPFFRHTFVTTAIMAATNNIFKFCFHPLKVVYIIYQHCKFHMLWWENIFVMSSKVKKTKRLV
jgi:hypothetical protein